MRISLGLIIIALLTLTYLGYAENIGSTHYYSIGQCSLKSPNRILYTYRGELYGLDERGRTWLRLTSKGIWVDGKCFRQS